MIDTSQNKDPYNVSDDSEYNVTLHQWLKRILRALNLPTERDSWRHWVTLPSHRIYISRLALL